MVRPDTRKSISPKRSTEMNWFDDALKNQCRLQGRIDKAAETFLRIQRIAPDLVEARLSGRWLSANPDYLSRAHSFFRIAAGLARPEAADMLR